MRPTKQWLPVLMMLALGTHAAAQQTQQPAFQSRADVIPVDASVLDARGQFWLVASSWKPGASSLRLDA